MPCSDISSASGRLCQHWRCTFSWHIPHRRQSSILPMRSLHTAHAALRAAMRWCMDSTCRQRALVPLAFDISSIATARGSAGVGGLPSAPRSGACLASSMDAVCECAAAGCGLSGGPGAAAAAVDTTPACVITDAPGSPCQHRWCTFTRHCVHRRQSSILPMDPSHTLHLALPSASRGCSIRKWAHGGCP